MKSQFPWAKALRVSPQQIIEWQDIAPQEVPLLFWCVENDHISAEEYLSWACDFYQIPVLINDFFSESMPFEKPPGDWHPWFTPIGEWDGVTYVACIEPPAPASPQEKICYVLASPIALQKAWASAPPPLEIPEGLTLLNKKPAKLNLPDAAPPKQKEEVDKDDATMVTASVLMSDNELDLELTSTRMRPQPTLSKSKLPPPPASLNEATSIEKAFSWAFAQVIGRYSSVMALRETNGQMLPWLWSANLKAPATINSKATSLEQPSLFRIAGKTRRPYHGFVVESEIHKEFFNAWGFAKLPACATAVPIIVQDQVWGLLLCIGEESAESPDALKLAEQTAEKIAQYLDSKIAAA